jgi:hypothetical protein
MTTQQIIDMFPEVCLAHTFETVPGSEEAFREWVMPYIDEGDYPFDGCNCDDSDCRWDGISRRCNCGNRRVDWVFDYGVWSGEAY